MSQSRRSDYTARVVGVNSGNAYWLLEADERKQSVDQICDDVFRMDMAYKGLEIGFEANAFQGLFSNIFEREEKAREHQLQSLRPIVHSTKVKKEHRIMRLVPLVQNGQIKIQASMTDLIAELMRWPKWHDDLLDALEELTKMLGPLEGQAPAGKSWEEQEKDRLREQMILRPHKPEKRTFHSIFGGFG
jgi:predicted phage terminase large subunit-like protein